MLNDVDWQKIKMDFMAAKPFNHVIIDNFFEADFAAELVKEFPKYDDPLWMHYLNEIENKKVSNDWNKFPLHTYQAFNHLTSDAFADKVSFIANDFSLHADQGLHGGGLHCHANGGNLNVHLDYSIHPKLKLQRKVNLIVYMTPDWLPEYGGGLELWSHDTETGGPKELVKTIENKFNRAVLFNTIQNSWHGLPVGLNCPEGVNRQSFAVYYVADPVANADPREKVLFAPYGEQTNDPEIMELIRKRSNINSAADVYRKG
jgi:2OG-Fe(II) oxygenase superfamily